MWDIEADLRAIRRAWRPRLIEVYEAALRDDPAEFDRLYTLAWERQDAGGLIAVAEALRAKGKLGDKVERRFAGALLTVGEFDAALALLEGPGQASLTSPDHLFRLGQGLAGVGRFDEARAALASATASWPAHRDLAEFVERVDAVIEARARLDASPGWSEHRAFVDACMQVGARAPAARALLAVLDDPPATAVEAREEVESIGARALELLGPRRARLFLQTLSAVFPESGPLAAAHASCRIRLGEAPAVLDAAREADWAGSGDRDLGLAYAEACEAAAEREAAIQTLGAMSLHHGRDGAIRNALASTIGRLVLDEVAPRFGPPADKPRIFNLVPFNDEVTMIKIRLREMADWVDKFVIVEGGATFTGAPKPLKFEALRAELAEYESKLLYVPVETFPDYIDAPWSRDFYQRDMAISALSGLWSPEDLVLLTDADEILNRRVLDGVLTPMVPLRMWTHRYFLNYRAATGAKRSDYWTGVVGKARHLAEYGCSYTRFTLGRASQEWGQINRAGWHFTSINDAAGIARKFASFAHQEINKRKLQNVPYMTGVLNRIRSGEMEEEWERSAIDDSFPLYVREHQDELRDLIL